MKRTQMALMFLLALSCCDQAPDDDSSPTAAAPPSETNRSRETQTSEPARSRRAATALSYELRGLPERRRFATKEACDVARKVVIKAQAKDDKKLGDQGILFPNHLPLVCFPLSGLDDVAAPSAGRRNFRP